MEYYKTIIGWVTQGFEKKDDKFVCIGQKFTAGDQVEYEDMSGEPIEIDTTKEVYYNLDMVQPDKDYYILQMWGLVDPQLFGPFGKDETEKTIKGLKEKAEAGEHSFILLSVSKGAKIGF